MFKKCSKYFIYLIKIFLERSITIGLIIAWIVPELCEIVSDKGLLISISYGGSLKHCVKKRMIVNICIYTNLVELEVCLRYYCYHHILVYFDL